MRAERRWKLRSPTRFGIAYVDFKTRKRTPKLSAAWFKEAARRNPVMSRDRTIVA